MRTFLKNPLFHKLASFSIFSYFFNKSRSVFSNDFVYDAENFIVSDSDYLDLQVKPSQLSKAGLGLFTKRGFLAKEIIGEYRGYIVDTEHSGDSVFDYETKMVHLNNKYVIIGRCIAAFANDCIELKFEKYGSEEYQEWVKKGEFPRFAGCEYNAEIRFRGNKAFLIAKEDIETDKEIFLDYGFDYWKTYYEYYDSEGKLKKV